MKNNNIIYYVCDINQLRTKAKFDSDFDSKLADSLAKIELESFSTPWSNQAFLESFDNLEKISENKKNSENKPKNNLIYHYFCAVDLRQKNKTNNIINLDNLNSFDNLNIIGYVGFFEVSKECFVTNIAVLKDFQNWGIGSSLLAQAVEFSKKNLFDFISLEVRASNANAIRLYQKLNFKQVGIRKKFYENPTEDALIFTLFF